MEWYEIVMLVLAIVLIIAGGYIKKLISEMKELLDSIHVALADNDVSKEELETIIKEAKDVKDVILEIAKLLIAKARTV